MVNVQSSLRMCCRAMFAQSNCGNRLELVQIEPVQQYLNLAFVASLRSYPSKPFDPKICQREASRDSIIIFRLLEANDTTHSWRTHWSQQVTGRSIDVSLCVVTCTRTFKCATNVSQVSRNYNIRVQGPFPSLNQLSAWPCKNTPARGWRRSGP